MRVLHRSSLHHQVNNVLHLHIQLYLDILKYIHFIHSCYTIVSDLHQMCYPLKVKRCSIIKAKYRLQGTIIVIIRDYNSRNKYGF